MQELLSQSVQVDPSLDLDLDVPMVIGNIDRLDQNLFVDNTPYAPCAYLVAADINPADGSWASRHNVSKTLAVAGSGAAPTYGNYSAIENTAVKYAGAKYHTASDTTWGQIGDNDGAIECLFNLVDGPVLCTTTTGSTAGYSIIVGSGAVTFLIGDGTDSVTTTASAAITSGAAVHWMAFIDKSDKAYHYVNGVYHSVSAATTAVGDSTGGNLAVGALSGGTTYGTHGVLQCNVWNLATNPFPGVLKNRTYFDRIARERFEIISGCQDQRKGAMSFTRATSAYLDRFVTATERRIFAVSAGWPRVCERKDTNGLYVKGYLPELANTNLCLQSETLATWSLNELTSVSSNAIAAPTGNLTADGFIANANSAGHGIYQALTLPATMHCFSVFAKKGNKDWCCLWSNVTNMTCYFDLANGTVGTAGAAVTASGIEAFGNDWYRCHVIFTGTADSKVFGPFSATADSGLTFTGDATTVNTYFWGAQVEAITEHFPSSYIPTTTGSVARNKDELSYNVRLPIVGNINDLSQALTIEGSSYDPCAYLVADDCQADGTWTSRHGAKSLAFTGAGTNPTPNWDKVSRGNTSVKYWASNYHTAADTTWGQITTGDNAFECVVRIDPSTAGGRMIFSTFSAAGGGTGVLVYINLNTFKVYYYGGGAVKLGADLTVAHDQPYHVFCGIDESDKIYTYVNGVFVNSSAVTAFGGSLVSGNLSLGAHPSGSNNGSSALAHLAIWDLPTNPWPGAATNQAVMGALARSRFNQLCRYESGRLDCEILHPNVDRQAVSVVNFIGKNTSDYTYLALQSSDAALHEAKANAVSQWVASGSSDVCNGVKHKLSCIQRPNKVNLFVDNAIEATDTSCELPTGQDKVYIGSWSDGTLQPRCLISRVKLFRNDRR